MNIFTILTPKSQTEFIEYDSTIRQALETFDFHKFSVVPLIDDEGKYVCTLSEGDILRYIKNEANFSLIFVFLFNILLTIYIIRRKT